MKTRGVTLIEAMVAAAIVGIAMGGILVAFYTETGVLTRTGRRFQAMESARQTLEQLKNEVGADTWPGGDLSEGDHGTYEVTDIYVDSDNEPDYKSVTATITWD